VIGGVKRQLLKRVSDIGLRGMALDIGIELTGV